MKTKFTANDGTVYTILSGRHAHAKVRADMKSTRAETSVITRVKTFFAKLLDRFLGKV